MMAYMGKEPNAEPTRVVIEPAFPNEGYALIKCGNTDIQVGYTLLHNLHFAIHADHPYYASVSELQQSLYTVIAEAQEGRTGDDLWEE